MQLCLNYDQINPQLTDIQDASRIMSILNSQEHGQKLSKKYIKRRLLYQKYNSIPPGVLLICQVLMIKSCQDQKYQHFNPEQPLSEMFVKYPVEASDEYTVFRVMENDPKHKLWFVLDSNLVLPEYFAEFEIRSDFGSAMGILENEEDEFVSVHSDLTSIYNTVAEDINSYQFENLEEYPTYELKAQDLDRFDIGSIKVQLVNYFKYCLSRSSLYELNPNLVETPNIQQIITNANQFLNLSNCQLQDIGSLKGQFMTLILSYNKIQQFSGLNELTNLIHH